MEIGIFILNVENKKRREDLLDAISEDKAFTESVSKFPYDRRNHILVILSFEDEVITHVATGLKAYNNITNSVNLVMNDVEELQKPIEFDKLFVEVGSTVMPHLKSKINNNGLLAKGTRAAVVKAFERLDPSIVERLKKLSPRRLRHIRDLTEAESENLTIQNYGLRTTFSLAGFSSKDVPPWTVPEDTKNLRNFLDGVKDAPVDEDSYSGPIREDSYIGFDFNNIPGFDSEQDFMTHRTFVKQGDSNVKLRVFMANRYPLETQTGADLIYYNETHNNFVFVQYKMMSRDGFRWRDGDKFSEQINDMKKLIGDLSVIDSSDKSYNYRFTRNPYFLKFIPSRKFDPDNSSLAGGFYFPLEYWQKACADGEFRGPKGGNVINTDGSYRYIDNHCFRSLVSNAWVGTSVEQSLALEKLIRKIVNDGRTVIYASLSEFS